jgi:hypothetical protein
MATMPGWLQPFTRNQPDTVTIDAVRALFEGGPVYRDLWQSVVWRAGILVGKIGISATCTGSLSPAPGVVVPAAGISPGVAGRRSNLPVRALASAPRCLAHPPGFPVTFPEPVQMTSRRIR